MLFALACFVMMTGMYGAVSIWRQGESRSLHHPVHWPSVARALFWDVFLGRRIWKQSRLRWVIFFFISMAFIQLFFVFVVIMVTRYIYPTAFFQTGPGGWVLDFLSDLLGMVILGGIMLALYRRYILKEAHLESQAEDTVILWVLLGIVITGFFLEACRLAVVPSTSRVYASFVGAMGASLLKPWDVGWTGMRFYIWFVHAILVFMFVAYLPFSKLFHVITCPATILATASEAAYKEHQ
jgi:nitrate reductase gamma subunit